MPWPLSQGRGEDGAPLSCSLSRHAFLFLQAKPLGLRSLMARGSGGFDAYRSSTRPGSNELVDSAPNQRVEG